MTAPLPLALGMQMLPRSTLLPTRGDGVASRCDTLLAEVAAERLASTAPLPETEGGRVEAILFYMSLYGSCPVK